MSHIHVQINEYSCRISFSILSEINEVQRRTNPVFWFPLILYCITNDLQNSLPSSTHSSQTLKSFCKDFTKLTFIFHTCALVTKGQNVVLAEGGNALWLGRLLVWQWPAPMTQWRELNAPLPLPEKQVSIPHLYNTCIHNRQTQTTANDLHKPRPTCAPQKATKHCQRIELRKHPNAIQNESSHPYSNTTHPLKEQSCHVTEATD